MLFTWNRQKAAANFSKHGVTFEEALTVFEDPLARIVDDREHSREEQREIIIGDSMEQRLLLVCFTARGSSIRIFSARLATKKERRDYEEKTIP